MCVYICMLTRICVCRIDGGQDCPLTTSSGEERKDGIDQKKKQRNTREVRLFGFHPADTRPSVRLNTQHLRGVKNAVYGVVKHRQVRVLRKHTHTHTHACTYLQVWCGKKSGDASLHSSQPLFSCLLLFCLHTYKQYHVCGASRGMQRERERA